MILTDQEIQAAYMTADSAELFARAIEQAVIERLAQGVSVERLKNIDWQQFAMHGGEPCFDLDRDGSLCGRARHWFGHNAPGSFVSLHDFATTAIAAARVQALEEAAKVCDRQAIEQAVIAKLAGVSVEPLFWVYEAGTPGAGIKKPMTVDPTTLVFRESEQNRKDELTGDTSDFDPIVVIDDNGELSILDGHNRASVAIDRGDSIEAVKVTQAEYDRLQENGFNDGEIAWAALQRAGQSYAAGNLDSQFSGSEISKGGDKAWDDLIENESTAPDSGGAASIRGGRSADDTTPGASYDERKALAPDGQYRYQFQANTDGGQTVGNQMRVQQNADGWWSQYTSVNGSPERLTRVRESLNEVLPSDEAVAKGWAIPVQSFSDAMAINHGKTSDSDEPTAPDSGGAASIQGGDADPAEAAKVQALEEAAKVCDRQAIPNAGFLAEKVRALINTNLTTGEMK